MTKMTYAIAIDNAINGNLNEETIEKLKALKESLARRNAKGGERKPTKTQKENAALKDKLFEFVADNGAKRAGDVATEFAISGQKASALLNQLVADGRLEKFTEKRVTYFREVEGV